LADVSFSSADTAQKTWQFQGENSMSAQSPHLLVFGPGYSAEPLMEKALSEGWRVSATWRRAEMAPGLNQRGINPVELTPAAFDQASTLKDVTHILVSIAPDTTGDPVLTNLANWIKKLTNLKWIGYLSSTNVYGDHKGAWVDETSSTQPSLDRGKRRLISESAWTKIGSEIGANVHIFRLAGIYGPGRNAIRSVLDGKAKRVIKAGQVFGRIHRDDITSAVWSAMQSGIESTIFNLADDLPAPPQDVITEAAKLLGIEPPPKVPFEKAELSPMGRSFYSESKRISNEKAKRLLKWNLKYPDFHTSLPDLVDIETLGFVR
jgi:nucleoside-diphosphate-sugar epimerase